MFDEDFSNRILAFNSDAATAYAEIAVLRRNKGTPIAQFDAQIAAIARSTGAALATRNGSDFEACEIELINPWWRLDRPAIVGAVGGAIIKTVGGELAASSRSVLLQRIAPP